MTNSWSGLGCSVSVSTIILLIIQNCSIRMLYILHIVMTGNWPSTSTKNFLKDLQPQGQIYLLLHVNKIYWNFHQSVCGKRKADIIFLYINLWNKELFLPRTDVKERWRLYSLQLSRCHMFYQFGIFKKTMMTEVTSLINVVDIIE